jgi:hypothetical protein
MDSVEYNNDQQLEVILEDRNEKVREWDEEEVK